VKGAQRCCCCFYSTDEEDLQNIYLVGFGFDVRIIRRPFFLLPSLLYCCHYLATRTFDSFKVQGSGRKWPLHFLIIIYWMVDKLTDPTVYHVAYFQFRRMGFFISGSSCSKILEDVVVRHGFLYFGLFCVLRNPFLYLIARARKPLKL
jgi:hypothetical protein